MAELESERSKKEELEMSAVQIGVEIPMDGSGWEDNDEHN